MVESQYDIGISKLKMAHPMWWIEICENSWILMKININFSDRLIQIYLY